MIENVIELPPKLQVHTLRELSVFDDREIPVVDSRSMEEPSVCVALASDSGGSKGIGVEVEISWGRPGIQDL